MEAKSIPILLVTANVGSIFEEPSTMLKIWTQEFLSTVSKLDPKFIALHCQEVGGKNYEKSMIYVNHFVKLLMTCEELRLFDKVRIFIDEDYSSAENFTALGNIYFIHETIHDILIWDFKELHFNDVLGTEIHAGNIETIDTKEKAKFPQDFFPECKWSRKGFMRTRWSLNGTVFDLINIHLFHDASNFVAMEEYPSVYCKNRQRALQHTLQRFHNDRNGSAPFFVFGDFNFRTNTDGVIKKLTEGLVTTKILNNKNNEYSKLQFHNDNDELILSIGKKEFNHIEHQDIFLNSDGAWLKSFDKEPDAFASQLFEFPLNFPPSYPFEENVDSPSVYMQTRVPAWCDRVLLSHTARSLVDEQLNTMYNVIGRDQCMGDHKPIYLQTSLHQNSGIVQCCQHKENACLIACKCCQSYASIKINIIDTSEYRIKQNSYTNINHALLHEPITRDMLNHDPYTPESIDSHSPMPEDKPRLLFEPQPIKQISVSPALLKTRLENILKDSGSRNLTKSLSEQLDFVAEIPKRVRCNTEINNKKIIRAKLISTDSAQSIHRLQSHHSSSGEEWFDFEDVSIEDNDDIFSQNCDGTKPNMCENVTSNLEIFEKAETFDGNNLNRAKEEEEEIIEIRSGNSCNENNLENNEISCTNIETIDTNYNSNRTSQDFEVIPLKNPNNTHVKIHKNIRNKNKLNKNNSRCCCCSIS